MSENSGEYTPIEREVIRKFRGRCVRCNRPFQVIHHLYPRSRRPDLVNDPSNLVPLCVDCHNWAHALSTHVTTPLLEKDVQRCLKMTNQ